KRTRPFRCTRTATLCESCPGARKLKSCHPGYRSKCAASSSRNPACGKGTADSLPAGADPPRRRLFLGRYAKLRCVSPCSRASILSALRSASFFLRPALAESVRRPFPPKSLPPSRTTVQWCKSRRAVFLSEHPLPLPDPDLPARRGLHALNQG